MNRRLELFLRVLIVAVICLLSGCSQRQAQSGAPLRKIAILLDWKSEPTYAGFYIARENGAYRNRGLDVDIIEGGGATVSAQVIGAGDKYFIGSCSGEATAIARSKGIPIKSVAVLYPNVPTVIYSRADTPIRTPKDMLGKRIGLIDGSVTRDEYRGLVAANNIDRSKIKEISVGFDTAPLLSRKVDGLMNYEELTPVELRLRGDNIVVMRFADFGLKAYSLNIIVNDSALAKESATIKDVVDATIEGYNFLRSHPDQAAATFSRLFPERDQAYVRESTSVVAKLLGSGPVGEQTQGGWQDTIATLERLGLLARSVSVDEVAAASYLKR